MSTYRKKILEVNLSSGIVKATDIEDDLLQKYIGGSGLAAKLFFDRANPSVAPLGPDNILLIMTGPLAGTTLPGTSRWSASFKSPLTGIWGDSYGGGNFAPKLKAAGYDGILVSGISAKPVYLLINNEKAEIRDASNLWGKDVYETTDILKDEISVKDKVGILSIGQAGENLVKFASVQNDKATAAGRCGGGAVMGSKRLKAIVVKGTGKVKPAMPEELQKLRTTLLEKCKDNIIGQSLKAMGTNAAMVYGAMIGDLPVKNWSLGDGTSVAQKVGGEVLLTYTTRGHACTGCPIACKRIVKVAEGPYAVQEGPGPQYETAAAFGPLLMHGNMEAVIKINELCNKYGVDTISCGSTIAFAIECFENGLITDKNLGGGKLRWGNTDDIMAVLDSIVFRKGFGDVLAEGSQRVAQRLGRNALDFTVTVKGLEAPMHDPRCFHGLGPAYAMSNRGACHNESVTYLMESNVCNLAEIGLSGPFISMSDDGKAELVVKAEDFGSCYNAMILCSFISACASIVDHVHMLKVTTGYSYDLEEMMQVGERIWMLKRGINNLMGLTSADDKLPKHILTATKEGGAAGSVPDIDRLLKEYYPIRGLSPDGRPKKEKLESLGLADLAAKLY